MGNTFMPFGGLRNEEAARSCGFTNRLQWAGFKKRHGIQREKTRSGMRYVLSYGVRRAGRQESDALKGAERQADERMQAAAGGNAECGMRSADFGNGGAR